MLLCCVVAKLFAKELKHGHHAEVCAVNLKSPQCEDSKNISLNMFSSPSRFLEMQAVVWQFMRGWPDIQLFVFRKQCYIGFWASKSFISTWPSGLGCELTNPSKKVSLSSLHLVVHVPRNTKIAEDKS